MQIIENLLLINQLFIDNFEFCLPKDLYMLSDKCLVSKQEHFISSNFPNIAITFQGIRQREIQICMTQRL